MKMGFFYFSLDRNGEESKFNENVSLKGIILGFIFAIEKLLKGGFKK